MRLNENTDTEIIHFITKRKERKKIRNKYLVYYDCK